MMATVEVTRTTRKQVTHYSRYPDEEADLSGIPQVNKMHQTMDWQNRHAADSLPRSSTDFDDQYVFNAHPGLGYVDAAATLPSDIDRVTKTRRYRIREAMFPQTAGYQNSLAEGSDLAPVLSQYGISHPTAVQRLADPSQKLRRSVINLINYEEDADVAAIVAPHLVPLLSDNTDPVAQKRAAQFAHKLTRKQAPRLGLATQGELVRALVNLFRTTNDPDTQNETLASLQHLAKSENGARLVHLYLTIPMLVQLLGHRSPKIVTAALSILHHLLVHLDEAKPEVRDCGGVQKMVPLLANQNPKFLAMLTDCLQILAFDNPETKLVILKSGGPQELVRIVRTYDYEKLLFAATRLIKVLSICPSNKPALVEAGAVQALGKPIQLSASPRLILSCLWGLRNLSDLAFQLNDVDLLIRRLIELLSSTENHVNTCAAGCLCNLTCQNPHNKAVLVQEGGVEVLTMTLNNYIDREEVTEPVCSALRHVTHRHQHASPAVYQVRIGRGLPSVVRLMQEQPDSAWPLVKAVTGLVRNLALEPESREELMRLGAVPHLCTILQRACAGYEEISRQRGSILSMQSELSYVDGVRLEDLIELALAALHSMAKSAEVRGILLRTPNVISLAVQMLYHQSDFLQRSASGVLSELALELEGARMIEKEGATSRLTELIHSRNEAVATYSAAVLHRLARDKDPDYKKRLSQELRQSLFDLTVTPDAMEKPPLPQFDPMATYKGGVGNGSTLNSSRQQLVGDYHRDIAPSFTSDSQYKPAGGAVNRDTPINYSSGPVNADVGFFGNISGGTMSSQQRQGQQYSQQRQSQQYSQHTGSVC